jgi:uncharacterized protein (TIGR02145 family)
MKKMIVLMLALLIGGAASMHAQVRIGGTDDPATGVVLDLNATDNPDATLAQGLSLPRVKLTATNVIAPLMTWTAGTFVYNTNTSGTGSTAVSPGIYYNKGASPWIRINPLANDSCGGLKTLRTNANAYFIAEFGIAGCWMTENLREVPAGGSLGAGSDPEAKYYNYPDNDPAKVADYGYLYSWAAATQRTGISDDEGYSVPVNANANNWTKIQGVCPSGWHIPSDFEWSILEQAIASGDDSQKFSTTPGKSDFHAKDYTAIDQRGGILDKKLKTAHDPVTGSAWDGGTSRAKNQRGFNVLPAGFWDDSSPASFGTHTYFWSSSAGSIDAAWYRAVATTTAGMGRANNGGKYAQFSVRCKKN